MTTKKDVFYFTGVRSVNLKEAGFTSSATPGYHGKLKIIGLFCRSYFAEITDLTAARAKSYLLPQQCADMPLPGTSLS